MTHVRRRLVAISIAVAAIALYGCGGYIAPDVRPDVGTTGIGGPIPDPGGAEDAHPSPTVPTDDTGSTDTGTTGTRTTDVPDETLTVATCETAAKQLQQHGWSGDWLGECTGQAWSQKLIECYTRAQNAADIDPCVAIGNTESVARQFAAANIIFDPAAKAEADLCYAGGKSAAKMCVAACVNGFAAACRSVGTTSKVKADARRALVRSCEVASYLVQARATDVPLTEAERQRELRAGYDACNDLAAPLFVDVAAADLDRPLLVHASRACGIEGSLTNGSAGTSCMDYGALAASLGDRQGAYGAYAIACGAGNQDACFSAAGLMVPVDDYDDEW